MHLEATIEQVWRPYSSKFGDTLGGNNRASLEMYLEAVIEPVWTSTWRQSMHGALGAEILFNS